MNDPLPEEDLAAPTVLHRRIVCPNCRWQKHRTYGRNAHKRHISYRQCAKCGTRFRVITTNHPCLSWNQEPAE